MVGIVRIIGAAKRELQFAGGSKIASVFSWEPTTEAINGILERLKQVPSMAASMMLMD
jgi:hypothetical protein